MKKIFYQLFFSSFLLAVCSSCSTPLEIIRQGQIPSTFLKERVEFLGFDSPYVNNKMIKGLPQYLEDHGLIYDVSPSFIGTFSDLSTYKSSTRYVSYITVKKLLYSINDDIDYNSGLDLAALVVASASLGTLFMIYGPMFAAANKNTTQISVNAHLVITVYDTKLKEVVINKAVQSEICDYYKKGKYYNKKTNKTSVDQLYQEKLWKEIAEYYKIIDENLAGKQSVS